MTETEIKALVRKKTKNKVGRPDRMTKPIVDEILSRIAMGEPLLEIVQDDHLPNYSSVMRWRVKDTKFREKYARARQQQAETWAEQVVWLAMTEKDVNRARLITDNMKWTASKLLPKAYGDHIEIDQNVNVSFQNGVPRPFIEAEKAQDAISSVGKPDKDHK